MTPRQATLWVVVGATATGKTAYSLELAKSLKNSGEAGEPQIVNADAMQFYCGMNVGTAKISEAEMCGHPHHFFDVLDISEEASVAWYQPRARALIKQYLETGNDVILVGGSGLYVSSVIYDFEFSPRDELLREKLSKRIEIEGAEPLLTELKELDPVAHEAIDKQNPRRIVRALEVALLGAPANTRLPSTPKLWWPDTKIIGTSVKREKLVERLNQRVKQMWLDGLLKEVQELVSNEKAFGQTASVAIGYKQALAQLAGQISETEAIDQTSALTRKYARRQVSWFKRYPDIIWQASRIAGANVNGMPQTIIFDEENAGFNRDLLASQFAPEQAVHITPANESANGIKSIEEDSQIEWFFNFMNLSSGEKTPFNAEGLIAGLQYLLNTGAVTVQDRRDTISIATDRGIIDALVGLQSVSVDLGRWRLIEVRENDEFFIHFTVPICVKLVSSLAELDAVSVKDSAELTKKYQNSAEQVFVFIDNQKSKHAVAKAQARFFKEEIELESSLAGAAAAALAGRHLKVDMAHHWRVETHGGAVPVRMFATEEGEHISVSASASF